MSIIKEFKEFAIKGSVIDLAVGVIVGAAFGKIVTSLVTDVIMPPIGLLIGDADLPDLKITLKAANEAKKTAAITLNYGNFINTLVQFIIIALCIFFLVKLINNLKRKEEAPAAAPAPEPTKEEVLLTEIRDLLAKGK